MQLSICWTSAKHWRFLLAALAGILAFEPARAQQAPAPFRDVVIRFNSSDGTPLEGKLSIPAAATGPVPVLFYLHGAGPGTFDTPRAYRGVDGQVLQFNYYDYFAREMAARGIAFFRINKRGCSVDPGSRREIVNRRIFSQATRRTLLDDYVRALEVLRARPEVDASRILVGGASEGTALAARLAVRSPQGIAGLVLHSYAGDNLRDILEWQNTVGPWRNIQHIVPAARDGTLTRAEYDEVARLSPRLAAALPFAALDSDGDAKIDAQDMLRLNRPRHVALVQAIERRDDDLLWGALLNLTSDYFVEDWTSPPTHTVLSMIDAPIGIFHGELDGTTRVEAVHETEQAFQTAGKGNLTVRIYPGLNHDLGWTPQWANTGSPEAFRDSFDFAASLVARQREPTPRQSGRQ